MTCEMAFMNLDTYNVVSIFLKFFTILFIILKKKNRTITIWLQADLKLGHLSFNFVNDWATCEYSECLELGFPFFIAGL